MDKSKIIRSAIEKYSYIEHTIIKKLHPEVNNIFGENNGAETLFNCINSYNFNKYIDYIYKKQCKVVEEFYKSYINFVAYFINSLIYNPSSEEIMYIYCYLLYNGYLSKDNDFKFLFPEYEIPFKYGLSVISGKGVCRNVGTLFEEILKEFKFETYGIITDSNEQTKQHYIITRHYKDLTELNLEEFIKETDEYFKNNIVTTGDHFEVLTLDNKWKLLDPSNCVVFNFSNKNNGFKALNRIKLWSLSSFDRCNIDTTLKLYKTFKDMYMYSDESHENIEMQKDCYKLCENNKQKIISFYEESKYFIDTLGNALIYKKK